MPLSRTRPTRARPVAPVQRALQVLDAFLDSNGSLTLAELSARTGLYKSTIGRILSTLELQHYVVRTASGACHVGPALLRLASRYQEATEPRDSVLPVLRALVARSGENASYVVPLGSDRIILYRAHSAHALRDHGLPGDVVPLDRGAAGHVFRAWREAGKNGRSAGHRLIALSEGEIETGMTGMASPVFDATGACIAAVALSGPATRMNSRARVANTPHLLAAAGALTLAHGGDGQPFKAALQAARRALRARTT